MSASYTITTNIDTVTVTNTACNWPGCTQVATGSGLLSLDGEYPANDGWIKVDPLHRPFVRLYLNGLVEPGVLKVVFICDYCSENFKKAHGSGQYGKSWA